jgi:hypothetical protein
MVTVLTQPRKGLFYWRKNMSWYNRKPKVKEQPKRLPHHRPRPLKPGELTESQLSKKESPKKIK